ncbi:unnamed protein product [Coffea canephora]|uniref:Uncharacterized protein n=1 Tax=Coffea canephora TaxID=49390 RepID=A0A068UBD3_COFCA|nr:unnamed protein product [Coffea canephora]
MTASLKRTVHLLLSHALTISWNKGCGCFMKQQNVQEIFITQVVDNYNLAVSIFFSTSPKPPPFLIFSCSICSILSPYILLETCPFFFF